MTTIKAEIIEDSVSVDGIRLTTMLLQYPRFIHAEFMTHRMFSRNASSSRAIPVERMIQSIMEDTAMPLVWTKNQPGMQGYEECNEHIKMPTYEMTTMSTNSSGHFHLSEMMERMDEISSEIVMPYHDSEYEREVVWEEARDMAIYFARRYHNAGYHKQIVNRLLEPFMHIKVLVTATDWANFYALRDHEMAEPHIQILAQKMTKAQDASDPRLVTKNDWHLPFVSTEEKVKLLSTHSVREALDMAIQLSVARCARTSYLTHEGKAPDIAADLDLANRLIGSTPLHASPAEHQATPDTLLTKTRWMNPDRHGNFTGWQQYRKFLPNENVK